MIILLIEADIKHLSINQRVVVGAYCVPPAGNENYLWENKFPHPLRASILLEARPTHLSRFSWWEKSRLQHKIPNPLV